MQANNERKIAECSLIGVVFAIWSIVSCVFAYLNFADLRRMGATPGVTYMCGVLFGLVIYNAVATTINIWWPKQGGW